MLSLQLLLEVFRSSISFSLAADVEVFEFSKLPIYSSSSAKLAHGQLVVAVPANEGVEK